MKRCLSRIWTPIGVLLMAVMLQVPTACTDVLAPYEAYPEPFSMYGLITPDRDTQYVWVSAIEGNPTLGSPAAMENVDVISTDLSSGEQYVWQDTVVIGPNGQHEFLFQAPFRATFDTRYRIEVSRRNSEDRSWTEVRVPPPVEVDVVEADRHTVTVEFQGAGIRPLSTEIEYRVEYYDWVRGGFGARDTSIRRNYHGKEESLNAGWKVDIRFNVDRYWVEAIYTSDILQIYYPPSPFLALGRATLYALVGDAAWDPPEGIFDPRILSQPGTLDNVQNGTGFVGGGYRIERVLHIPQEAVEAARFYYCSRPWNCIFGYWPGDPNG